MCLYLAIATSNGITRMWYHCLVWVLSLSLSPPRNWSHTTPATPSITGPSTRYGSLAHMVVTLPTWAPLSILLIMGIRTQPRDTTVASPSPKTQSLNPRHSLSLTHLIILVYSTVCCNLRNQTNLQRPTQPNMSPHSKCTTCGDCYKRLEDKVCGQCRYEDSVATAATAGFPPPTVQTRFCASCSKGSTPLTNKVCQDCQDSDGEDQSSANEHQVLNENDKKKKSRKKLKSAEGKSRKKKNTVLTKGKRSGSKKKDKQARRTHNPQLKGTPRLSP